LEAKVIATAAFLSRNALANKLGDTGRGANTTVV